MSTTVLPERITAEKSNYIPRVGAVHDLCGYGNCSLSVAISVLSSAGCDVCSVPTSLFSAHTKYEHFYMHDTTSILHDYIEAWKVEDVNLDAVYSGFLGSSEQVDIIKQLYTTYPQALHVVDPVMGDGGMMYATYTQELCDATKQLVHGADILLPNLTEAALLTGKPYSGQAISKHEACQIIANLVALGAKRVVLKGIETDHNTIVNYVYEAPFATQDVSTLSTNDMQVDVAAIEAAVNMVEEEKLPFSLHGTGDVFASCVCAGLLAKKPLVDTVAFAARFVRNAMWITRSQPEWEMRGVSFEPLLGDVAAFVK